MITALYVTKMESRKYVKDNIVGTIHINHDITLKIPRITEKITAFGNKSVMSIDFQMFISYLNPSIGEIMFEGCVDYFVEKPLDIIAAWNNAESEAANKIKTEVGNNLMGNIIPFASMVAQKMELPPVFPIPRIAFGKQANPVKKEEQPSYIG